MHEHSRHLVRFLAIGAIWLAQGALGCGSDDKGPPVGAPSGPTVIQEGGGATGNVGNGTGGGNDTGGGFNSTGGGTNTNGGSNTFGTSGSSAFGTSGSSAFGTSGSSAFGTGGSF